MVEMNGKILRDKKLTELKEKINELDCQLGLAVIQVGNDEASNVYVKQKEKFALELGYKFVHKVFKEDVEQDKLIRYIKKLNKDESIDGILVQMPLPKHLDSSLIQNTVDSYKDVDGLTFINAGRLVQGMPSLVPCTPKGIVDILDEYKIKLGDKYNYIDLLLYNIKFKCYVVVELKITELKKEHIGQIQTYMNYIDKNLKTIEEDKTIGIIIVKKNNKYIMEYCSEPKIITKEYELLYV
jgi:hypothetical protein